MLTLQHYIGGELRPPLSSLYLDNHEPATGLIYSRVPAGDAADVAAAVAAAQAAFAYWSQLPADERSTILLRIAEGIERRFDELALAESTDTGKPLALARRMDIPRAASNFRFFAHAVVGWHSESHPMPSGINYTLRQPLGVVGCISPWNLPLYLFTWKVAPALAVGCTVVAKPTEVAPMTAYLLSQICIEAGLPPGVLNIVHGTGPQAGNAIVEHTAIKAISFTGGTATGAAIARKAAPMFKKLSLELGGKNPALIFADCDYERALATTLRSSYTNQGQICLCSSRIYIERSIYNKFRDDLVARAQALVVGDPRLPETDQGALSSAAHLQKVLGYIELAKQEDGRILTGGQRVVVDGRCAGGWFVQPTIIEGLPVTCRTNQEEIFGPVITLQPFDTEAEAVQLANAVPYGLASTVWTSNLSRAHRVAAAIESGIVWVNCWLVRDLRTPFGGSKASGVGREGGTEALRFFTEPKNVCVEW